jgi:hypothetical protein
MDMLRREGAHSAFRSYSKRYITFGVLVTKDGVWIGAYIY